MVGLGNPGPRFSGTRHNVGFAVLEEAAARLGVSFRKPLFARYRISPTPRRAPPSLVLAQPLTYMNRSGEVLPGLLSRAGSTPEQMLVICDNLDLEPGRLRMKSGGGTAGHRGLASIVDILGHGNFLRLYVGVGRPTGTSVVDHVLGVPPENERELYEQAIARAADAVLRLADTDPDRLMTEVNRRDG